VVVREGSFTAAAKILHMTQPAVSSHIKALEAEVGSKLMDRNARGIRLTATGKVMVQAAEVILGTVEDTTRRIREMEAPERGTVMLACGDTVALQLLPPVLAAFRRLRPLAEVAIRNHGSRRIVDLVLRREADLGIVTRGAWLDAALWARTILVEPFWLALPPGHPLAEAKDVTADRLDGEPAVFLARPSETRALVDQGLDEAGVKPVVVMESGNLEVVKAYVHDGMGLSILPDMAITATDRKRMRIHPLPETFPRRRIAVVRRKDRVPSLLATDMLRLLAERFHGASGDPESTGIHHS
jgi:DNA-binding transcriptional LysR family regulator